jgi:peptidyl-prolyl cis-trans isomerase D
MIQFFKDRIQTSWVIKAFLVVLALSFGIWGVGDFIQPGMDPGVAVSVGKRNITLDDLQRRYTREMDRFRETIGSVDSDDLRRSILNSLVQDITRTATVDAAAQDMGIVVTEQRLREEIRNTEAFKDEAGNFDQLRYSQTLAQSQLTEQDFIDLISSDLRVRAMLTPAAANAAAPKAMLDTLLAFRGETRVAETIMIKSADLPAPAPKDEDLKKFYDENAVAFTAPEYRKISAVVLHADDLVPPSSITDEELRAFYEENIARYRTRETRRVSQLVFETKEAADSARAKMAPGDDLADIAQKAGIAAPVDLGDLTADAPLAKTLPVTFELKPGEVSQPVESDLGWHLLEVKSISPEVTQEFTAVREQIRSTMAEDRATDQLYDASVALEDGVAAGEPLADVAERINGRLITIEAMDSGGRDPRGLEAKGLIDNQRFVQTAFATAPGAESKLMEIPKGYYVLKVESATPPAAKPFEEVRGEVAKMWDRQQRITRAREIATKLMEQIGPSTALNALAAKEKASFAQIGPVNRFGQALSQDILVDDKRMSQELLGKIFSAKVGDVVSAPVVDGVVIARVREVIPASGNAEVARASGQMAETIQQGIAADLTAAMTSAFTQRYPSEINTQALDSIVAGRAL